MRRKRRFGAKEEEPGLADFERAPLRSQQPSDGLHGGRLPVKRADGALVRNVAFDGKVAGQTAAEAARGKRGKPPKRQRTEAAGSGSEEEDATSSSAPASAKGSIANLSPHQILRRRARIRLEMGELCEQILATPNKAVKQQRSGPSPLDQLLRWCKRPGRRGLPPGSDFGAHSI